MNFRSRIWVTPLLLLLTLTIAHLWYAPMAGSTVLFSTLSTTVTNPVVVDPDIIDSEFNHHAVGWALIAMALLIGAQYASPRLEFLQRVWPFIFIAAGIFLMVWSDKEIWPRGQLSWTWLIHHDPEARQHKIYAVLLILMGGIEYLRGKGKLTTFWQRWAFPVLAMFGAVLLLVHDHGGGSGLPAGWDKAEKEARIAEMRRKAGTPLSPAPQSAVEDASVADYGSIQPDPSAKSHMSDAQHDMTSMSHMDMDHPAATNSSVPNGDHSRHVMTLEMMHVQRQHLWYTLMGISVALFKFLADGKFFRFRWLPYGWPVAMALLGVLLTGYTE
jgi:hypothetical protein